MSRYHNTGILLLVVYQQRYNNWGCWKTGWRWWRSCSMMIEGPRVTVMERERVGISSSDNDVFFSIGGTIMLTSPKIGGKRKFWTPPNLELLCTNCLLGVITISTPKSGPKRPNRSRDTALRVRWSWGKLAFLLGFRYTYTLHAWKDGMEYELRHGNGCNRIATRK